MSRGSDYYDDGSGADDDGREHPHFKPLLFATTVERDVHFSFISLTMQCHFV